MRYNAVPVPLLSDARPAGWVTYCSTVYARVQCGEPKTGQLKVQFYCEYDSLFLSSYYLSMVCSILHSTVQYSTVQYTGINNHLMERLYCTVTQYTLLTVIDASKMTASLYQSPNVHEYQSSALRKKKTSSALQNYPPTRQTFLAGSGSDFSKRSDPDPAVYYFKNIKKSF